MRSPSLRVRRYVFALLSPFVVVAAQLAGCGAGDPAVFGEASSGATSGSGAAAGSSGASSGAGGASSGVGSASSSSSSGSGQGGSGSGGGSSGDKDGDGLDDAWEQMIAESYLPFLSIDPDDGCPLGGLVFRLRPHPADSTRIHLVYVHLFENDCGLTGHVGDDEVFGVTVDPAVPPPAGILALQAVTHQGTICEKTTKCGSCPGLAACTTAMKKGAAYPVAFSSKDKHATYVEEGECNFLACFDSCSLAPSEPPFMLVNAGEPDKHLTDDLTTSGLITAANGWKEQALFNYNPWDPAKDFGSAGNVASDLVDAAFESPVCP